MTTTMKKGELFVKEVINRIKGDDKEALANKIARKALSAIEGQIAALRAKEVDDENALEDAQEAFDNAVYPTELFTDNKAYCAQIASKKEKLNAAKDNLEQTKDSIAFFESQLAKF